MAKLDITALVPDDQSFLESYEDEFSFGNHSGTKATFIEVAGDGDYYTLHGKGFAYDGQTLVAGTVKSVTFFNGEGVAYATLTGLNLNAAKVLRDPWLDIGDLVENGLRGNDIVRGSAGDDYLFCGRGNNTVTGRAGSDVFFAQENASSIITDFDADGGGTQQDYVFVGGSGNFVKDGRDTVYEYETGHTLTFVGVRVKDLTADDFFFG